MKKSDLMIALGERMTDSVSQSYTFPAAPTPQLPFVHVWPDANEVGRVWRPTLGLPCSPHEVIKALLVKGAPPDAAKRRGWVERLNAIHRGLLAKEWNPTSDGINFAAIVCEVDKHLAPDAVVTTDAGNFGSFVHRYIGFRQTPRSFCHRWRRCDGVGRADGGGGRAASAGRPELSALSAMAAR